MIPRLLVDIDGVLADFNPSYVATMCKVANKDVTLPQGEWPTEWSQEVTATWGEICAKGSEFWYNLPSLPGVDTFIDELNEVAESAEAEVYFVTSRPGWDVKAQTELWLYERGMDIPTVIPITWSKGVVAKAIGATHAVDDKPSNCEDIDLHTNQVCRTTLYAQPYNAAERAALLKRGIATKFDLFDWLKESLR
jgi:hypothetical protein